MVKRGQHNRRTAFILFALVGGMVGLSFASVPLYRLFCQVTGYGGTPQISENKEPAEISERTITVRFDSNTNPKLPWRFKPVQKEMTVRLGEQALAFFEAESLSDTKTIGQATYNVTPFKAGSYFNKIACFCFDEQVLMPGQSVSMPVQFFVDPEIFTDPNTRDVKTITLSYTFFRSENEGSPEDVKDETAIKVSGQIINQNQIN